MVIKLRDWVLSVVVSHDGCGSGTWLSSAQALPVCGHGANVLFPVNGRRSRLVAQKAYPGNWRKRRMRRTSEGAARRLVYSCVGKAGWREPGRNISTKTFYIIPWDRATLYKNSGVSGRVPGIGQQVRSSWLRGRMPLRAEKCRKPDTCVYSRDVDGCL
jgi:hypothetical protein